MPTYDYVCDACKHAFEAFHSMTEKPLRTCPKCKKPKLRRLIGSGAGIIFKGSGFYQTDYKKSGGGSAEPSKPSKPSGDAKPSSGTDAGGDKSCGSCGKTGPNVCD